MLIMIMIVQNIISSLFSIKPFFMAISFFFIMNKLNS
jgi:hypothetical protein